MRNLFVLMIGLLAIVAWIPVQAADKANSCKDDPRIIETCRWVKGTIGFTMRAESFIEIQNDRAFLLDDDSLVALNLPGLYKVGEFEFCRFKDKFVEELADADGTTVPVQVVWGCINAARNVIPEPDQEKLCEFFEDASCNKPDSKP